MGEVKNNRKNDGVGSGNYHLASLGREAEEDPGGEDKEKNSSIDSTDKVHFIINYNYIF